MDKSKRISFPSFEIPDIIKILDARGYISTHRIQHEYNKYKLGKIYYHSKLGFLQVMSITKMIDISYSPTYQDMKNWTKRQQEQLMNSNKIEYIVLKKV
jgi:hypothetical protein